MKLLSNQLIPFFVASLFICSCTEQQQSISGRVTNGIEPLPNSRVRVKTEPDFVTTDANGRFHLSSSVTEDTVLITAWHDGYYINSAKVNSRSDSVEIVLTPHPTIDDPNYRWIGADPDHQNASNCAHCHETLYKQWKGSAHAVSAVNSIVLNMYAGTDALGKNNIQPGYKLDFKESKGDCATCHAPVAAIDDPYQVDLSNLQGIGLQGVFCDFCHKISSVQISDESHSPGILSIQLLRPNSNNQLFLGPYDDVDAGRDSYNPWYERSDICAPCHMHSSWGTPIYQSYPEWLASPYAKKGIHCQNCHMRPDGVTTNVAPGKGGVERNPETIFTHNMPGARDTSLLASAVDLEVNVALIDDKLQVVVQIENVGAGHHMPTGQPMRNMILLVQAHDANGNLLTYVGKNRVPGWGGTGDPKNGNYARLPGKGFAKVLVDISHKNSTWRQKEWEPVFPAPQWRPTIILADNRIPATQRDESTYEFLVTRYSQTINVNVDLIYRRAFKPLADIKGWKLNDLVIAHKHIKI